MSDEPSIPSAGLAVETHDLWRVYKLGPHQEVNALRGVNLSIQTGQFVALKGRSGSGKTTLLNCIGGLDRPTRGQVRVFDREVSTQTESQLTHFRRKQIGFIFQSFGLTPTYSAIENVELMLQVNGLPYRKRHERALQVLHQVGLEKWLHHRPDEMSGGQQQRVAVARALANGPRLILADEPTGDLDTTTAREILALFRRIVQEEKVTILLASHDPLVEAYVDRVLHLKDGQIEETL